MRAWLASHPPRVKTAGLTLLVVLFYALHQDVWNWTAHRPLVWGFLPPGLAYHAAYCVGASLLMAILVRWAWPRQLEAASPPAAGESPAPPGGTSLPRS